MSKLWLKHQKFLKGNAGFSLVELIIVIAIMAALIAILAPQYIKYVEKSRVAADQTIADELYNAVQVAASDVDAKLGAGDYVVTWNHAAGGYAVTAGTTAPAAADITSLTNLLTASLGATSATNPPPMKAAAHTADYVVTLTIVAPGTSTASVSLTETAGW